MVCAYEQLVIIIAAVFTGVGWGFVYAILKLSVVRIGVYTEARAGFSRAHVVMGWGISSDEAKGSRLLF